jgi:asparagine synthase (glutamine-hydrolysing)
MSALAGIVRFDGGPPDVATVARMIDCVEHRGRDRRDVRADGAVALAYRWHRTGPAQPVDQQPIFDRLADTALVFDGRLDNRPELGNDLELRDEEPVPDAAFVLAAYRRWGHDMVPRLLGAFSSSATHAEYGRFPTQYSEKASRSRRSRGNCSASAE